MKQRPGYAFAQALAKLGVKTTIHGTTGLPDGGEVEHASVTLDGVVFDMDVQFGDELEAAPPERCPACGKTPGTHRDGRLIAHANPPCPGSGVLFKGSHE